MLGIALVEDHTSFRELLKLALERDPELRVVAQAGSLAEARALREGFDLAIVDISLLDGSAIGLVRELSRAGRVLVLTASTDRMEHARVVEAGAGGVLTKFAHMDEICAAVHRLSRGESLLGATEKGDLLRLAGEAREREHHVEKTLASLTRREREVLSLLAEGLSDREISEHLCIGRDTVHTHVSSVLSKLGVHSRLQAVLLVTARRNRL